MFIVYLCQCYVSEGHANSLSNLDTVPTDIYYNQGPLFLEFNSKIKL